MYSSVGSGQLGSGLFAPKACLNWLALSTHSALGVLSRPAIATVAEVSCVVQFSNPAARIHTTQ